MAWWGEGRLSHHRVPVPPRHPVLVFPPSFWLGFGFEASFGTISPPPSRIHSCLRSTHLRAAGRSRSCWPHCLFSLLAFRTHPLTLPLAPAQASFLPIYPGALFYLADATKITLAPSSADINLGDSLTLQCHASHDPTMDLTFIWTLDDFPIDFDKPGGHYRRASMVRPDDPEGFFPSSGQTGDPRCP